MLNIQLEKENENMTIDICEGCLKFIFYENREEVSRIVHSAQYIADIVLCEI